MNSVLKDRARMLGRGSAISSIVNALKEGHVATETAQVPAETWHTYIHMGALGSPYIRCTLAVK